MKMLKPILLISALSFSSPALADDWTLNCKYEGGLEIILNYVAGDPSYNLYVASSGDSDLGRGQRYELNHLMSPDETILFTRKDGDVQILFRVLREELESVLEVGSQVSWDYRKLEGTCSVLEQ